MTKVHMDGKIRDISHHILSLCGKHKVPVASQDLMGHQKVGRGTVFALLGCWIRFMTPEKSSHPKRMVEIFIGNWADVNTNILFTETRSTRRVFGKYFVLSIKGTAAKAGFATTVSIPTEKEFDVDRAMAQINALFNEPEDIREELSLSDE